MAYIYMDESGDLGFDFSKKRTTKFFIITVLVANDKRIVNNVVKKIFVSLNKKQLQSHKGVLHAYHETTVTRRRLLTKLAEKDVSIFMVYLDKSRYYTRGDEEKPALYNIFTNILLDRLMGHKLVDRDEPITLIASQRDTSRFLNENFSDYLSSQFDSNHKLKLTVEVKTPHQEKGLQVVDIVSWSIFRKYEYRDSSYYELIKHKIVEEQPLIP